MKTQFIKDKEGNKIGVFLPIADYKKLMEELEELDDIKLYDKVKKEDDGTRILFEDYVKYRKENNA